MSAPALVLQSHGTAEMIGMGVGDHHRVDVIDGPASTSEAVDQMVPRFLTGKAGIDDGDPPFVLEDVAVDVSQPGHVDRELRSNDPGGHLDDVGRRLLLLLLRLPRTAGSPDRSGRVMVVLVLHGRCRPPSTL